MRNSLFCASQSLTVKPGLFPLLADWAQLFFWLSHDRPAALAKSVKVEPSTVKGRVWSPVWRTCSGTCQRERRRREGGDLISRGDNAAKYVPHRP